MGQKIVNFGVLFFYLFFLDFGALRVPLGSHLGVSEEQFRITFGVILGASLGRESAQEAPRWAQEGHEELHKRSPRAARSMAPMAPIHIGAIRVHDFIYFLQTLSAPRWPKRCQERPKGAWPQE